MARPPSANISALQAPLPAPHPPLLLKHGDGAGVAGGAGHGRCEGGEGEGLRGKGGTRGGRGLPSL